MRVKFSQTYEKNNFFIWGRLFSSSSLIKVVDNHFFLQFKNILSNTTDTQLEK